MDEYLTSVRELEARLGRLEGWARNPKPKVDAKPPVDVPNTADIVGRTRLMFDLAHLAIQTDSTRLVTILLSGTSLVPPIKGVNLAHHDLSHHGQDPAKLAQLRLVETEKMRLLGGLLDKLKATKEAGGNLLGRTMVFFGSNLGNASSHSCRNLPCCWRAEGSSTASTWRSARRARRWATCSCRCCAAWGSRPTSSAPARRRWRAWTRRGERGRFVLLPCALFITMPADSPYCEDAAMASYKGHLMLAAPLGAAYGAAALMRPQFDWGVPLLGTSLCTIGGLLPDLDSDSGVSVRELFGLASTLTAVLLLQPVRNLGFTLDQSMALVIAAYLFMRLRRVGHLPQDDRPPGMFHSIPAMLIAGLAVYLAYPGTDFFLKCYLGGAVMAGYLSHLVLDEFYSIDFNGVRLKFNQFAGTALKFGSPSWPATLCTYAILFALGYVVWSNGLPDFAKMAATWKTVAIR